MTLDILYLIVGILLGSGACYFALKGRTAGEEKSLRERLAEKDGQANRDREELARLQAEVTRETAKTSALEAEIKAKVESFEAQQNTIKDAEKRLSDAFASLSQDALKNSADQFLQLAKENFEKHQEGASGELKLRQQAIEELVKPLKESIEKLDKQNQEIEEKRASAYASVNDTIAKLMTETTQLSSALRKPHVRGSWGELTLKRAAEAAGLTEGQDFEMQHSTDTEEGRLRPDMVVRLPNKGTIVVDSKVPLDAYLNAVAATDDETKAGHLRSHANQVRTHIQQLGSKSYWSQFERSPDFVVMFVPSESLFQAAMEQDTDLIESAFKKRVVLANPMTLIALLRTVAYGMQQEQAHQNSVAIMNAGANIYKAVRVFSDHFSKVGRYLEQSTRAYNEAVGSMDRNILSKTRQMRDLSAAIGDEFNSPEAIDLVPRLSQLSLPDTIKDEVV